MSTKIRKSIKKYNRGISKAIPPSDTFQIIFKKINKLKPGILDRYYEVKANTKIPQYIVRGTDHYLQTVNDVGRVQFAFNSNGKGHFKTQAQVSGLMELAERYSCCKYLFNTPKKVIISSFKAKDKQYSLEDFYSNPIHTKKVEILKKKDGSYAIIDYKTSRFTAHQDALHNMYKVQLNGIVSKIIASLKYYSA